MDARILPEGFAGPYEALFARALSDGGVDGSNHPLNGSAGVLDKAPGTPVGQYRVSSGESTSIGKMGGPKTKQVGKTARTMKDERAFRVRVLIDKRLRKMGREIEAFLDGKKKWQNAGLRACAGRCKKFGDGEWVYCPWCGGPMREMENED